MQSATEETEQLEVHLKNVLRAAELLEHHALSIIFTVCCNNVNLKVFNAVLNIIPTSYVKKVYVYTERYKKCKWRTSLLWRNILMIVFQTKVLN